MTRCLVPCSLLLMGLLSAERLAAQYLNRSVYLGREVEGVRRNYEQGKEYYVDRLSYVDLPPWWRDPLRPFGNSFQFAGGSVSSTDLTLETRFDYGHAMDETATAGMHVLQSEHQGAQHSRMAARLELELERWISAFAMIEGTADKGSADLSAGIELFRKEEGRLRLMATFVDFASRKSQTSEYLEDPLGLMLAGDLALATGLEGYLELSTQLPLEQRLLPSGTRFEMRRSIGFAELRYGLGQRDRLILEAGIEGADKQERPLAVGDPLYEDHESLVWRTKLEWWHRFGEEDRNWDLSAALSYLRQRSDGLRPNDPAQDLLERREDLFLFLRSRHRLGEKLGFEPSLWLGRIDYQRRLGGGTTESVHDRGFEGKLGLEFAWNFNPAARITIMPTFQLDEAKFGGGSIRFLARW